MPALNQLPTFWRQLQRQYDPVPFLHRAGRDLFLRPLRAHGLSDGELLRSIRVLGEKAAGYMADQIPARVAELRQRVLGGEDIFQVVPEAFALAREASRRATSLFPYDCQVLAGLVMCRGSIAEMATGEGKTLAVIFPAFVHALLGEGVHIATVNSYLAQRDQEFTRPIFELLGLSSALLPERAPATAKRQAYAADITYGVGTEFGFDYLRDQMLLFQQPTLHLGDRLCRDLLGDSQDGPQLMQRALSFAIIDEADSILIDEALTPLLLSGAKGLLTDEDAAVYHLAYATARTLALGEDYIVDPAHRIIAFQERGQERMHSGPAAIPWDRLHRPWTKYVENALKAEHFFQRDANYIVQDTKVVLVDEFTGRAFADRSWREGLHQAVEAKENVPITAENTSLASISRQRFYGLYSKICGMSGTVLESAGELWRVYHTGVQPIPQHRPSRLQLLPDRVFRTEEEKLEAAVLNIVRRHATGQPILVGTRTIQSSEQLASRLDQRGLTYRLLNAKQDSEEAEIISRAGQRGAITLATNMAGRGAHISLGPGVAELGGLHVIGMERHESRRVDRQLLGRSARQGEPGSGQMFLSPDDYLLQQYAPDEALLLKQMDVDTSGELSPTAARIFDRVQMEIEKQHCRDRTGLMGRDRWMEQNKQRLG